MEDETTRFINSCYWEVKELFVLRAIYRLLLDGKGELAIRLLTCDIPLGGNETVSYLINLEKAGIIEFEDLDFDLHINLSIGLDEDENEIGLYSSIRIYVARNKFIKYYKEKLTSVKEEISTRVDAMQPFKQVSLMKDIIKEKQMKLSKDEFVLVYDDIPSEYRNYVNLYFALIYLECRKELSLRLSLKSFYDISEKNDELKYIAFILKIKPLSIDYGWFKVDFGQLKIIYRAGGEKQFKITSDTYKLLTFLVKNGGKITYSQLKKIISPKRMLANEGTDIDISEKQNAADVLSSVRKGVGIKADSEFDIFKHQDRVIFLRKNPPKRKNK